MSSFNNQIIPINSLDTDYKMVEVRPDFIDAVIRVGVRKSDETMWFCTLDIGDALEVSQPEAWLRNLEIHNHTTIMVHTSDRKQRALSFVSEPTFYKILATSRSQKAKPFQDWLYSGVLVEIRKTGKYDPQPQPQIEMDPIKRFGATLDELNKLYDSPWIDDALILLGKEALGNGIKALSGPVQSSQASPVVVERLEDYFTVEELRTDLDVSEKMWLRHRGSVGKALRAAIQAANPDAEPKKIPKLVNGAMRDVNGWHRDYFEIAIATAESYFRRLHGE